MAHDIIVPCGCDVSAARHGVAKTGAHGLNVVSEQVIVAPNAVMPRRWCSPTPDPCPRYPLFGLPAPHPDIPGLWLMHRLKGRGKDETRGARS
jgi:hypothetical protein